MAYNSMSCGVSDQRLNKLVSLVLLHDRWNETLYPDTTTQREMILRFMPNDDDLHIIMKAAQHMGIVGEYTIAERFSQGLAVEYANIYKIVQYTIGQECLFLDADGEKKVHRDIHICDAVRCKMWVELFFAAGYNVKLCTDISQMLNVRKEGCRVSGVNKDHVANALTYAFTRNHISCSTINT